MLRTCMWLPLNYVCHNSFKFNFENILERKIFFRRRVSQIKIKLDVQ